MKLKRSRLSAALPSLGCAAAQSGSPEVRGQVVDWGGQPGLTALLEISTNAGPYNLADQAPVDARGRFDLPLTGDVDSLLVPAKAALNVAPGTCRDAVRLTAPGARPAVLHRGAPGARPPRVAATAVQQRAAHQDGRRGRAPPGGWSIGT